MAGNGLLPGGMDDCGTSSSISAIPSTSFFMASTKCILSAAISISPYWIMESVLFLTGGFCTGVGKNICAIVKGVHLFEEETMARKESWMSCD
jgi:hypothetical protein